MAGVNRYLALGETLKEYRRAWRPIGPYPPHIGDTEDAQRIYDWCGVLIAHHESSVQPSSAFEAKVARATAACVRYRASQNMPNDDARAMLFLFTATDPAGGGARRTVTPKPGIRLERLMLAAALGVGALMIVAVTLTLLLGTSPLAAAVTNIGALTALVMTAYKTYSG
jgi:hypothetical protein